MTASTASICSTAATGASAGQHSARIIVTIDTEEEGLWSGQFATQGATVANVQAVPRFQHICDELGIAPTYLVNTPVITNDEAAAVLKEIQLSDRCEIGAHIHPWNTSPVDRSYDAHGSYMCNLPLPLQREKLQVVTQQIRDTFEVAPRSFRAGRYGLDGDGAKLLSQLGYIVDSSVCPFTDYSADGGPDFRSAPFKPYWLGADILRPAAAGDLLEVPVSFGFNRANFALSFLAHEFLQRDALKRLRAIGVLDRLRILQKIKFSPEKGDATRLIRLAKAYSRNRAPCMVMMFHSSSLVPGNTPYVKSNKELDEFLANLRDTLAYCISELNMKPATLTEFALHYGAGTARAVMATDRR